MKRTSIVGQVALLIIGIIFIAITGIVSSIITASTKDCTESAVATIADTKETSDDMYKAVYEYEVDGRTYQGTDNTSTSWRPSIGEKVDILYNPSDPTSFVTESSQNILKIIFTILGGVGWLLIAIAVITLIVKIVKIVVLGAVVAQGINSSQNYQQQQGFGQPQQGFNQPQQGFSQQGFGQQPPQSGFSVGQGFDNNNQNFNQ